MSINLCTRAVKRIIREIGELNASKDNLIENGIYFHCNDDDITTIYAMIIGTSDTPYEDGYYFFTIHFKGDYPLEPPKVFYHTQGSNIRFNPNLYVANNESGGKVCLSMINTWSGPGWVPTLTITNVLMAIQALVLVDEPLKNEPGYSESNNVATINHYTNIIRYCNIQTAIFGMIKSIPTGFEPFQEIIEDYFLKKYENIGDKIMHSVKDAKYDLGKVFAPCYNFVCIIDYQKLFKEFLELLYSVRHKKGITDNSDIKYILSCNKIIDEKLTDKKGDLSDKKGDLTDKKGDLTDKKGDLTNKKAKLTDKKETI